MASRKVAKLYVIENKNLLAQLPLFIIIVKSWLLHIRSLII